MDASVPVSAHELLATPPGTPDATEAESGTLGVNGMAAAADVVIGDVTQLSPSSPAGSP